MVNILLMSQLVSLPIDTLFTWKGRVDLIKVILKKKKKKPISKNYHIESLIKDWFLVANSQHNATYH